MKQNGFKKKIKDFMVEVWLKVLALVANVTLFFRNMKAHFNEFCAEHGISPEKVKKVVILIVKVGLIVTISITSISGDSWLDYGVDIFK